MSTAFKAFIILGGILMITGLLIALYAITTRTVLIGAMFCWMSLPLFWLAGKVQN